MAITEKTKQAILKAYAQGVSRAELSRRYRLRYATVHTICAKSGMPAKSKGPSKCVSFRLTYEQLARAGANPGKRARDLLVADIERRVPAKRRQVVEQVPPATAPAPTTILLAFDAAARDFLATLTALVRPSPAPVPAPAAAPLPTKTLHDPVNTVAAAQDAVEDVEALLQRPLGSSASEVEPPTEPPAPPAP